MTRLKKPITLETAFAYYVIDEIIGEGGAGRVYGGVSGDTTPIALKILAKADSDKRRRFKNEIAFLGRNAHKNIVTVIDHGVASGELTGPFYVMHRYRYSLRDLMRNGINANSVLPFFSQVLDGVEAAHLLGVVHRDLKPENILYDGPTNILAIADFGIARFTEELMATTVETGPAQKLANFQYAAPEQRTPGGDVSVAADIYALGLILNEMFTGAVPHGTGHLTIRQVADDHGFLDEIVEAMRRQSPADRPASVADVKRLIQRHHFEAVSLQRLSQLDGIVVKANEVDEPLALTPPRLVDAAWNRGTLTLTLDRPVTPQWVHALYRMGSYSSVYGKPPQAFNFHGKQAVIGAQEHEVQMVVDNFKTWLPMATRTFKLELEQAAQKQEQVIKEQLRRDKEEEERRLRVMRNIKI